MLAVLAGLWLAGVGAPAWWWWRQCRRPGPLPAVGPESLADRRRELLADLAPRLAHEVITPLAAVRGHLDILREALGPAPGPVAAASLRMSVTEVERVTALARDLVTLTAARAGSTPRTRERAGALAEEAVLPLLPVAEAAGVQLRLVVPATPAVVEVATGELVRALRNLVDNALRHGCAAGPGEVTVQVSVEGGRRVRLAVADPGPGIPAEQLERLCRPFARGGGAGRAGLGLAIVAEVLAAHASRLETGPGGQLSFTLPLAGQPERAG